MEISRKLPPLLLPLACLAQISHAAIIINEFDYDQEGADTAEFIELFNTGGTVISLDNYSIDLINGNNLSTYRTIDLNGFSINTNDYFVVCGDASLVANCDYSFTTSSSWFQNGAPDAIALFKNTNLLDSVSYEGNLFPYTEGATLPVKDNNNNTVSISRFMDNNDNALDYDLGCITPGSQNIAGTGDCSMTSVSAVPVPTAVWLFSSGLLGLIGFARKV
jgi:predicted extracellular nuclease